MDLVLRRSQRGYLNLLKKRLDIILTEREYYASREKAKASIMAGVVFVDGLRCDKAGSMFDDQVDIFIKSDECPYVSRGGLKLAKAISEFQLALDDKICVDIGASTGGFTDCMLKNGASKVYAIDVGYGQLDWKLRNDQRVVNIEKCNVRYLDINVIEDIIDFISIDVSFISLKLIFPVARQIIGENGQVVCLIKPQFEAGRDKIGKNGIVRDENVRKETIENVKEYAITNRFTPIDIVESPIQGAKGNVEYLLLLKA